MTVAVYFSWNNWWISLYFCNVAATKEFCHCHDNLAELVMFLSFIPALLVTCWNTFLKHLLFEDCDSIANICQNNCLNLLKLLSCGSCCRHLSQHLLELLDASKLWQLMQICISTSSWTCWYLQALSTIGIICHNNFLDYMCLCVQYVCMYILSCGSWNIFQKSFLTVGQS